MNICLGHIMQCIHKVLHLPSNTFHLRPKHVQKALPQEHSETKDELHVLVQKQTRHFKSQNFCCEVRPFGIFPQSPTLRFQLPETSRTKAKSVTGKRSIKLMPSKWELY